MPALLESEDEEKTCSDSEDAESAGHSDSDSEEQGGHDRGQKHPTEPAGDRKVGRRPCTPAHWGQPGRAALC